MKKFSIIIPAYNEEKYIGSTLGALKTALVGVHDAEVIVVDNESTDATREIAESYDTKIVDESEHNIGAVRNTGARVSSGDVLVFIDADTIVPPGVFEKIVQAIAEPHCLGGSSRVVYEPVTGRPFVSFFMKLWPVLGKFTKIRGGALQFCRREIFEELGGYDTTIFVGEDIDFHWRMDKLAASRDGFTEFIEDPPVGTSSRRWQNMGLLRMLFFTHPVTIFLGWRMRSLWKDWYDDIIR